jgi:hypothetical protein
VDRELASYIRTYFSELMTDDERLALKYHMFTYKTEDNPKMRQALVDRGWITERKDIQEFLKDGYEEFELNVANRVMTETAEKVFLNNCPKCKKLARTPFAKQCRYCKYNWHDKTVAQFKLTSSFQLTDRQFFLIGQITNGEIKKGQFMDLTMLGLNKRPKIEAIEFVLKRQDEKSWEDIALGTIELTQEDKDFLILKGTFEKPFDIITER